MLNVLTLKNALIVYASLGMNIVNQNTQEHYEPRGIESFVKLLTLDMVENAYVAENLSSSFSVSTTLTVAVQKIEKNIAHGK